MNLWTALAIYFIVWWVVLFAVLPVGVRTQAEADEVAPGTVPSAPQRPMLVRKFLATSVIALVVTAGVIALLDWADF